MAMPKVREALDARIPPAPPAGAPAAAKEAHRLAKLQVERSNIDLLATGQWRSFGRDVAFVDKTTGLAVTLPGGKPLVMSLDDLKTGAARKPVDPAPTATVPDLSKTGADTTAADIAKRARDARRQQAPPAPVQSAERVPTFGGGASRLPE
jgi:hypothetical protein